METSSVDNELLALRSKNLFLCMQYQKNSLLLFKDAADLRMDIFAFKQKLHTLSLGSRVGSKNKLKIENNVTVGIITLVHLTATASLNALYVKQQKVKQFRTTKKRI